MAKFKFSPLVESARGKFGNAVFSANKSGAYMRQHIQPRNPNTGLQSQVRAAFGSISRRWRELTQEQREAWNTYSKQFSQSDVLGQNVQLSGFQLFTKLNNSLVQIGADALDTPGGQPFFFDKTMQVEGEGTAEPYLNSYYGDDYNNHDDISTVFYVTGIQSVGRQSVSPSEYRISRIFLNAVSIPSPINLPVIGIDPRMPAGQKGKVFIKVEQVHKPTGWRSQSEYHVIELG